MQSKGKEKQGEPGKHEEERKKKQREDMETTSGSLSYLWGSRMKAWLVAKGRRRTSRSSKRVQIV